MYTEEEFNNKEEFYVTKKILRSYNVQWKPLGSSKVIGNCTNLYRRLNPSSPYDFYLKYTDDGANLKLSDTERGRTEDEIMKIAESYQAACLYPQKIPYETFLKNVYLHIIWETWDGQQAEKELTDYFEQKNYLWSKPDGLFDSKYSVDFILSKGNDVAMFIQVKPISFFIGNKNFSLLADRAKAMRCRKECDEIYQKPTYYMIYTINEESGERVWLTHSNGKTLFNLEELMDMETCYPHDLTKYDLKKLI